MKAIRSVRDYGLGAMLGAACGDALGTTNEFARRTVEEPRWKMQTGPLSTIIGAGPFNLKPGQVTDDTHMACALAAALAQVIECGQEFDAADVARRYVAWRRVTFDIGGQTSGSLSNFEGGISALRSGMEYWKGRKGAAGNGSLMRTSPIGALLAGDAAAVRDVSLIDSAITHFDPRATLACAVYNAAIAFAVFDADDGEPVSPLTMLTVARDEIPRAAQRAKELWPEFVPEIDAAAAVLAIDLKLAEEDDPFLYGEKGNPLALDLHVGKGFVRVAFRLAFWELLHASSYSEGVIDVVNRGGDADTNGAIAGGLLGAFFGKDQIPEAWKALVLGALQDGEPKPLRDEFHPKVMVACYDRLCSLPETHEVLPWDEEDQALATADHLSPDPEASLDHVVIEGEEPTEEPKA